jgi:cytochrome c2
MKTLAQSASAAAIAVAMTVLLSACGGPPEEPMEVPATAAASATDAAAPAGAEATAAATDAVDATPTPDASAAATPAAGATPAAAAAPAAVAAAGPPQAFSQCSACHKVAPGEHGLGPSLAGVYGTKAGHLGAEFQYSQQMLDSGMAWNEANLDRYLADPRGTIPGTKMAFAGVKDASKRAEIIAYLKTL